MDRASLLRLRILCWRVTVVHPLDCAGRWLFRLCAASLNPRHDDPEKSLCSDRRSRPGGLLRLRSAFVDDPVTIAVHHHDMAFTRLKKLLAASALAVAINGGASAALAHDETSTRTGDTSAAQQRPRATAGAAARTAADRQRRSEGGWVAEQLRAERASRR